MAFSDDEVETVLQSVSNHHFVDNDGAPISFALLPIILDDVNEAEAPKKQVSMRGTTDGGLQAVFKEVVAWKLRLDGEGPEISVLCKDKNWIKLKKPKKSYEECIRTTLMTIHLLHFLKKNPEASMKSICEYLRLALRSSIDQICKDDFRDHIQLVKLFLKRDKTLAKSQILRTFVKDPDNAFVEDFHDSSEERPFIVDDTLDDIGIAEGNDSDDESDVFDYVCAICDNGGELLCCEGRCLRSFHATREAGQDLNCASLGFTRTEVEAMQNFVCKNCQLKQHQCFVCGKLGSSNKFAKAEVFSCILANCGYFYHPKCVADLLHPENKTKASDLEKMIATGKSFACPGHRCTVCKQVENKDVEELQFAVCRRCPKAYHRKCLPRKIGFVDIEKENIIQRAWEGLLPNNRILIYCLKHDIDKDLGTPSRNHIIFPEFAEIKREADGQRTKTKENRQVMDGINRVLNIVKPAQTTEKVSTKDGSHTLLKAKIDKPTIDIKKAVLEKAKVTDSTVFLDAKHINSAPKVFPEIRKEVLDLVEEESSSSKQDDIRKILSTPSTLASFAEHTDKTTTFASVKGAIEDVHTALEKIESHGVEYAKSVCKPEILKQIADKLLWYVQDGDMVVDFSCGTKEFSLVMKAKLDATGKNCSLKNYDILQSKNGLNFEMRDWMTVMPKELPTGTKLIIVLNPPFGANVHLANQLIDKALTFKSKLLVLIAPEETRRLDKKDFQYKLIWKDSESISRESFYLPGSMDDNDKQMEQCNVKPPVLYFWSRSDWTAVHKGIALSQGHISRMQPALLVHKKAQEEGGGDAPLVDNNAEEMYKEKYAIQGESMSSTKQGIAVQAQVQVERRNDAPQVEKLLIEMYEGINAATEPLETRRKVDNKKNYIHETSKKRETILHQKELGKEVDNKQQYSEERPKRKRNAVPGHIVCNNNNVINMCGGHSEVHSMAHCMQTNEITNGNEIYSGADFTNQHRTCTMQHEMVESVGRPLDSYTMMQFSPNGGMSDAEDHPQGSRFSLRGSQSTSGHAPTSTYRFTNPAAETSASQRYAPQVDDMNFRRLQHWSPGVQLLERDGNHDKHGMRGDIPLDASVFASEAYPPFPNQGSCGWISD